MHTGYPFTIANILATAVEETQVPAYFAFIPIFFAIACYFLAKKNGRNPIFWSIIGLMLPPFPLIALAILGEKKETPNDPIKETSGNGTMHNDGAAALNDDAFEMPKAPRISSSKSLHWHYISGNDNEIKGPFSLNDLRKEIHTHKLDSTTYIWCDEFEEWTQIAEFSNASLLLDSDFIE